jgi:hypothetical protein
MSGQIIAVFTLVKVSVIRLVTMTCDSDMLVLALATLGSTTEIGSFIFFCQAAQGGQDKNSSDSHVTFE